MKNVGSSWENLTIQQGLKPYNFYVKCNKKKTQCVQNSTLLNIILGGARHRCTNDYRNGAQGTVPKHTCEELAQQPHVPSNSPDTSRVRTVLLKAFRLLLELISCPTLPHK